MGNDIIVANLLSLLGGTCMLLYTFAIPTSRISNKTKIMGVVKTWFISLVALR